MIWYVTGSTGLIGSAVIERLVADDYKVVAISRTAKDRFESLAEGIIGYNFDLSQDNPSEVIPPSNDDSGILALASSVTTSRYLDNFEHHLKVDTLGHLRLIEYLRPNLRHIVYTSSCTVYGYPSQFPIKENAPLAPQNIYSLSKVGSELVLGLIQRDWGIPVTILRISQTYGSGANLNAALYKFLEIGKNGGQPRITCPPETFRDYCHLDDVIQSILNSIRFRKAGVYNIGGGKSISMLRLAKICLTEVGSNRTPIVEPHESSWNMALDISLAQAELDYFPKISIEEGIHMEFLRLW